MLNSFIKKFAKAVCLLSIAACAIDNGPEEGGDSQTVDNFSAFIVAMAGDVAIVRDEVRHKARVGDALKENDLIETGENAFCQVQFSHGSIMRSNSKTQAKLEKLLDANGAVVRVITGDTVFKVEKQPQDEFVVKTATNEFRVRGTQFVVRADENGSSVATISGSVDVHDADGNFIANAGKNQQINLDRQGKIVKQGEADTGSLQLANQLSAAGGEAATEELENLRLQLQQADVKISALETQGEQLKSDKQAADQKADAAIGQWQSEKALVDRYRALLEQAGITVPEE